MSYFCSSENFTKLWRSEVHFFAQRQRRRCRLVLNKKLFAKFFCKQFWQSLTTTRRCTFQLANNVVSLQLYFRLYLGRKIAPFNCTFVATVILLLNCKRNQCLNTAQNHLFEKASSQTSFSEVLQSGAFFRTVIPPIFRPIDGRQNLHESLGKRPPQAVQYSFGLFYSGIRTLDLTGEEAVNVYFDFNSEFFCDNFDKIDEEPLSVPLSCFNEPTFDFSWSELSEHRFCSNCDEMY